MSAAEAHPNGTSTSGGRDPVEHWAVRRWVSEVDGLVTITGTIADDNPGAFGNGVVGRIFVGGAEVLTVVIDEGDTAGVNYSVTVSVGVGTTVDFALDPRDSQDLTDTTVFTAAVEFTPAAVPEPAPALLLGAGAVGLAGSARRSCRPPGRPAEGLRRSAPGAREGGQGGPHRGRPQAPGDRQRRPPHRPAMAAGAGRRPVRKPPRGLDLEHGRSLLPRREGRPTQLGEVHAGRPGGVR